MSKDILLMSACPPPVGGIATWTMDYIDYCNQKSYSVDLVNISLTGERRNRNVNVKRNIKDELFRTRYILRSLKGYLKSDTYRVFHINSSCSRFGIIRDYLSVRMSKQKGMKVIFHCHCHIPTQIHDRFLIFIFRKICALSDTVIVLNVKSKEYVDSLVNCKNTLLIPNFIEISCNDEDSEISSEIKEILYVGHVIKQKGIDHIIDCAKICNDLNFTLVGPVDEYYKVKNMPSNIKLLGAKKHDEVIELLKKADLFLFPSYSEGFSISMLEAMCFGLPIIASDVGANRDMILDKGGIILSELSGRTIKEAISKMRSVDTRKKMSNWNKQRVKANYSKNLVLDNLFKAYGLSNLKG